MINDDFHILGADGFHVPAAHQDKIIFIFK